MFYKIFFFISILLHTVICKKYICDRKNVTVYLQKGEIAFFETPQFPTLRKWEKFCGLTFMIADQSDKDHQFIAVIRHYFPFDEIRELKIFVINQTKYFLEDLYYKNAQQGFILFEDKNDGCPLESISRMQPFMFTDDTQILHIRSSYYTNFTRKRSCRWQFTAPSGYGFKIVVEKFDVSVNTILLIQNDTDKLVSNQNLQLHHPYYNSGKWIQIYLSKSDPDFIIDMEIEAYISIVNQNFTETIFDCIEKRNETDIVWTNFDYRNIGYGKNVQCTYNLVIKPHTEIYVTINKFVLEKGVDYVAYYLDNIKYIVSNDKKEDGLNTFVLAPFYNNTEERHVLFEFVSDGSVQSLGFEIRFSQIVCKCADEEITCDKYKLNGINKYKHPLYPHSYCGNMKCNFTIRPCHTDYMSFKLTNNLYDYLRIFSNGVVVAEFSSTKTKCLEIFLNSSNVNNFEVFTYPSPKTQSLGFYVRPFNVPFVERKIVLTVKNPSVIIDTGMFTLATVEVSAELRNQNISFIGYSNLIADTFWIFNNQSLTYRLTNNDCFLQAPYKCEISEKSFAIYSKKSKIFPFAVFRLSKNYGGCVFSETIFYLDGSSDTYQISDLANPQNECIITILINQTLDYYISDIWTSAKNENVSVFIGTDQNQLYFEFNSETFSSWKNVKLLSKTYIIKIPKKAALWIKLSKEQTFLTVLQYPSQSVIATPHYSSSTMNMDFKNEKFMTYVIGNFVVKLSVKSYNLPAGFDFFILANNKKIYFNKTGDFEVFKNQIISLCYKFPNETSKNWDHGLIIYINTLSDMA